MLIVPFPQSSLNEEAGKLFMESYEDYYQKARIITQIYARERTSENIMQENGGGLRGQAVGKNKNKSKKGAVKRGRWERQRSRDKSKDRRKGVLRSLRNQQGGVSRSGSHRKLGSKIRDKKWFRRI